ncbi:MAG: TIGR03792 family protein [Cyanobacteriota bacterium]|jgi:uncharacterized protein (TIGR03792 family)
MDAPCHPGSLAAIRHGLQVMRASRQQRAGDTLVAIVEHLRLKVPSGGREAWIQAEHETWDPWLRQQKGFVEREVLWDSARGEGVLLIHWASDDDWKAIPAGAVAAVQARFEAAAKRCLALPPQSENPFPLVFAGEIQQS